MISAASQLAEIRSWSWPALVLWRVRSRFSPSRSWWRYQGPEYCEAALSNRGPLRSTFQGLGEQALQFLRSAADEYKLKIVTEVMDRSQIDLVEKYADILQIGARNMQNYTFLKDLGRASKPVLLKRGLSATIEEWLMSAEYILAGGNHQVILCERGIRTFETATRNTLDIGAIPVVQKKSHLPVFADPSHGIGIRDKVIPMARGMRRCRGRRDHCRGPPRSRSRSV